MAQAALPLTALSEAQRTQALERLEIIRPALEKHVSQAQVARTHQIPPSTIQLWIKRYREKGLAGLTTTTRSDKGKSRKLPDQAIVLVEGLALQTPPRSAAAIHRQVTEIAQTQEWKPPSYERVRQIIKSIDPALLILAHQGAAAYREAFDLLYRREATQAHQGREEFLITRRFSHLIELLIVDEANKLKDAGLELMRDFADRGEFGLVLLGMPGLEKRLMHAPQLYSRVGFAQEMEPLSDDETRDFLEKRWSHRVKAQSDNFTDKEAVATILRITRGNIRLIERLMLQVEHILVANQTQVVTKDVVETAQQNLIIEPG